MIRIIVLAGLVALLLQVVLPTVEAYPEIRSIKVRLFAYFFFFHFFFENLSLFGHVVRKILPFSSLKTNQIFDLHIFKSIKILIVISSRRKCLLSTQSGMSKEEIDKLSSVFALLNLTSSLVYCFFQLELN